MERSQHFGPTGGATYQVGRITLRFKNERGDSGSSHSVVEAIEPPGAGAGYHQHPTYDETFIILEGHYDFTVAGEKRSVGPGETLVLPRGTPHGFTSIGPETGRQIVVSSPGGVFEAFIKEITDAMAAGGTVDFRAIGARHGIEFLDVP